MKKYLMYSFIFLIGVNPCFASVKVQLRQRKISILVTSFEPFKKFSLLAERVGKVSALAEEIGPGHEFKISLINKKGEELASREIGFKEIIGIGECWKKSCGTSGGEKKQKYFNVLIDSPSGVEKVRFYQENKLLIESAIGLTQGVSGLFLH